jgi:hypothetical protein
MTAEKILQIDMQKDIIKNLFKEVIMANDTNMITDVEILRQEGKIEQADELEELYHYRYGFEDISERNFEKLKQNYIRKYGWVDNYI